MRINLFFLLVLLAFMVGSVTLNLHQMRKGNAQARTIKTLEQAPTTPPSAIVARQVTPAGIEQVTVAPTPAKTPEQKAQAVGGRYLDTVTNALKVAVKQISEMEKVKASLSAENLQLRAEIAANGQPTGKSVYKDKWLSATYDPDSNSLQLQHDVNLNRVRYWERSWLLAPKRYYNKWFSDDGRVRINEVQAFTEPEPRQKRFGFGIQVGYGYPIQTAAPYLSMPAPYVGVGASYNLASF